MKDFTRSRGRLRSLPLSARAVYSVFLLFTLAAMGMTGWLAENMVGLDAARVAPYYAGSVSTKAPRAIAPLPGGGPALELPADTDGTLGTEPMPLRKLLEVTHFHLFSLPVYLLILSHLFMLSRSTEAMKIGWISLGAATVAGHIAAPWVARTGAAGATALYAGSGALMALSFAVMSGVPLWEMWAPQERAPAASESSEV